MTASSSTSTAATTSTSTTTTILRHPTLERPKKTSIVGRGSLKKFDASLVTASSTPSTDTPAITLVLLTPEQIAEEKQKEELATSVKVQEEPSAAPPKRPSVMGGPPNFLVDLKSQLNKRKLSTVPDAPK